MSSEVRKLWLFSNCHTTLYKFSIGFLNLRRNLKKKKNILTTRHKLNSNNYVRGEFDRNQAWNFQPGKSAFSSLKKVSIDPFPTVDRRNNLHRYDLEHTLQKEVSQCRERLQTQTRTIGDNRKARTSPRLSPPPLLPSSLSFIVLPRSILRFQLIWTWRKLPAPHLSLLVIFREG